MKEDTQSFLLFLKYYLAMVLRFGFKSYKINQMHFVAILHVLQLIKHIYYGIDESFEKNMQA